MGFEFHLDGIHVWDLWRKIKEARLWLKGKRGYDGMEGGP